MYNKQYLQNGRKAEKKLKKTKRAKLERCKLKRRWSDLQCSRVVLLFCVLFFFEASKVADDLCFRFLSAYSCHVSHLHCVSLRE